MIIVLLSKPLEKSRMHMARVEKHDLCNDPCHKVVLYVDLVPQTQCVFNIFFDFL